MKSRTLRSGSGLSVRQVEKRLRRKLTERERSPQVFSVSRQLQLADNTWCFSHQAAADALGIAIGALGARLARGMPLTKGPLLRKTAKSLTVCGRKFEMLKDAAAFLKCSESFAANLQKLKTQEEIDARVTAWQKKVKGFVGPDGKHYQTKVEMRKANDLSVFKANSWVKGKPFRLPYFSADGEMMNLSQLARKYGGTPEAMRLRLKGLAGDRNGCKKKLKAWLKWKGR